MTDAIKPLASFPTAVSATAVSPTAVSATDEAPGSKAFRIGAVYKLDGQIGVSVAPNVAQEYGIEGQFRFDRFQIAGKPADVSALAGLTGAFAQSTAEQPNSLTLKVKNFVAAPYAGATAHLYLDPHFGLSATATAGYRYLSQTRDFSDSAGGSFTSHYNDVTQGLSLGASAGGFTDIGKSGTATPVRVQLDVGVNGFVPTAGSTWPQATATPEVKLSVSLPF